MTPEQFKEKRAQSLGSADKGWEKGLIRESRNFRVSRQNLIIKGVKDDYKKDNSICINSIVNNRGLHDELFS